MKTGTKILIIIFALMSLSGFSQNDPKITLTGTNNQATIYRGAVGANTAMLLPQGTHEELYPDLPMRGRIQLNSETNKLEVHNGAEWVELGSSNTTSISLNDVTKNGNWSHENIKVARNGATDDTYTEVNTNGLEFHTGSLYFPYTSTIIRTQNHVPTQNNIIELPGGSGTIPLSVNGKFADIYGNIEIGETGGGLPTAQQVFTAGKTVSLDSNSYEEGTTNIDLENKDSVNGFSSRLLLGNDGYASMNATNYASLNAPGTMIVSNATDASNAALQTNAGIGGAGISFDAFAQGYGNLGFRIDGQTGFDLYDNVLRRGLKSSQYFGDYAQDNDYVQKLYVDNKIKSAIAEVTPGDNENTPTLTDVLATGSNAFLLGTTSNPKNFSVTVVNTDGGAPGIISADSASAAVRTASSSFVTNSSSAVISSNGSTYTANANGIAMNGVGKTFNLDTSGIKLSNYGDTLNLSGNGTTLTSVGNTLAMDSNGTVISIGGSNVTLNGGNLSMAGMNSNINLGNTLSLTKDTNSLVLDGGNMNLAGAGQMITNFATVPVMNTHFAVTGITNGSATVYANPTGVVDISGIAGGGGTPTIPKMEEVIGATGRSSILHNSEILDLQFGDVTTQNTNRFIIGGDGQDTQGHGISLVRHLGAGGDLGQMSFYIGHNFDGSEGISIFDSVNSKGITTFYDYSTNQMTDDKAYASTKAVKRLIDTYGGDYSSNKHYIFNGHSAYFDKVNNFTVNGEISMIETPYDYGETMNFFTSGIDAGITGMDDKAVFFWKGFDSLNDSDLPLTITISLYNSDRDEMEDFTFSKDFCVPCGRVMYSNAGNFSTYSIQHAVLPILGSANVYLKPKQSTDNNGNIISGDFVYSEDSTGKLNKKYYTIPSLTDIISANPISIDAGDVELLGYNGDIILGNMYERGIKIKESSMWGNGSDNFSRLTQNSLNFSGTNYLNMPYSVTLHPGSENSERSTNLYLPTYSDNGTLTTKKMVRKLSTAFRNFTSNSVNYHDLSANIVNDNSEDAAAETILIYEGVTNSAIEIYEPKYIYDMPHTLTFVNPTAYNITITSYNKDNVILDGSTGVMGNTVTVSSKSTVSLITDGKTKWLKRNW